MAEPDADNEPQMQTLVLAEVLDLKAATPLAESLLAHRGSDIVIEAGAVARLGAQPLQVLLSAVATWQADGRLLEFAHPSDAFLEGLQLFGCAAERLLNHSSAA